MYQHILVPVDGSLTSICGLKEAIKLAKLMAAELRLIHVLDDLSFLMTPDTVNVPAEEVVPSLRAGGERILAEALALVEAEHLQGDVVLRECYACRMSDVIVQEVEQWPADLVVIGTHGRRGGKRFFMGSDAEQILRVSPVPVLLVRAT